MSNIHIIHRGGEIYNVNEKDQFSRITRDGYKVEPSDTWKLTGAVEFKFGRIVRRYSVEDIRAKRVPWKYKNGKQRCFVTHYDHGSYGIQMSPGIIDVMVTG